MKGLVGIESALIKVNNLPPTAVEDSRAGTGIAVHRGAYQSSIWASSPPKYCILHPPAPAHAQGGEKGYPTPSRSIEGEASPQNNSISLVLTQGASRAGHSTRLTLRQSS